MACGFPPQASSYHRRGNAPPLLVCRPTQSGTLPRLLVPPFQRTKGNFVRTESEVSTIDQHAAYVRRLSMTPIIASLANPTAIMARAS